MGETIIHKLTTEFVGTGEVSGFEFKQIAETELGYIYSVSNYGREWYEVFRRKTTPVCLDFEKRIYSETEFKEVYPKGEAFGVWAWTSPDKEKALTMLNNLPENETAE